MLSRSELQTLTKRWSGRRDRWSVSYWFRVRGSRVRRPAATQLVVNGSRDDALWKASFFLENSGWYYENRATARAAAAQRSWSRGSAGGSTERRRLWPSGFRTVEFSGAVGACPINQVVELDIALARHRTLVHHPVAMQVNSVFDGIKSL